MTIAKLPEAPTLETLNVPSASPSGKLGGDVKPESKEIGQKIDSPKWRQWYAQLENKFNSSLDTVNIIADAPNDSQKFLSGTNPATWTLPKVYYGEMSYHNDSSPYTQAVTINIPSKVACFSAATSSQQLNGFTYSSSELTCQKPGMYKVTYNVSVSSSSANEKLHFYIAVGGSLKLNTEQHGKVGASTDIIALSGTGLITLSNNDKLSLYIMDESGSATITFYAVTVCLIRIGD